MYQVVAFEAVFRFENKIIRGTRSLFPHTQCYAKCLHVEHNNLPV